MADKVSVYDIVTEKVLAQLEAGVAPWHRPWKASGGVPLSMSSGKAYRGINPFLLVCTSSAAGYTSPYWGTYKQIVSLGGLVRKGEKGTLVVFWKQLKFDDPNAPKGEKIVPMLRYYNVFNADQADTLPAKYHPAEDEAVEEFDPIETAENIVANWKGRPLIAAPTNGDRACYDRHRDRVEMPERKAFNSGDEYYSTLFHELTHSTGHKDRLARDTLLDSHFFGDANYSREELVAEMGAAMLSSVAGIDQVTLPNSVAYLANWMKALKGDSKLVVQAAGQAQKAADMVLGVSWAKEEEVAA